MRIQLIKYFLLLFCISVSFSAQSQPLGKFTKAGGNPAQLAAGCSPASATIELSINNTRALLQASGDMWWDLIGRNTYEIPKGSGRMAMFNGCLWLGGQDVSGQLKVAAQRYRGNGNDFWTGPLSTETGEIDAATCNDYDKHFPSYKDQVTQFVNWTNAGKQDLENGTTTQEEFFPGYQIPDFITEWPAHGRNYSPYNEDFYLAPFIDLNGDGIYNPAEGDYPGYDLNNEQDCGQRIVSIYGDQNIWWIFNDKGNIHTESGSNSIGMEIRAQAFGFATNDEVNNMTFYNYELVNRSSYTLTETYFGFWTDGALGDPFDDYVGCDVERGLGYFYNGDEFDGDNSGYLGYGSQPPAIGVDFFQGPFQDNDGKDNCLCDNYIDAIKDDGIVYKGQGVGYGDGIIDNERFGMRKFLYHANTSGAIGDPTTGVQYYNFLRGMWKDGTKMTYDGNGYGGSLPADYMFPDDTDPLGWGTEGAVQPKWTEQTAGNTPFDRRFLQSAGPFVLGPGMVNNITVGVVWAQASSGGAFASVEAVRRADQKTQALFDNCFRILNSPDAPELAVQELDKELILYISNTVASNNYKEKYQEIDPFIVAPDSLSEAEKVDYATYKFQGYLLYQVKDGAVAASDLHDPELARLVGQCDIKDGISKIINFNFDNQLLANVPVLEVDGANEGIVHSFRITDDQFASGDRKLINHKKYFFMAIAYAYNNYKTYNPADPLALDGQKQPFLGSRKSAVGAIKITTGIPHLEKVEANGTILNSAFGDEVSLTRIEGSGNGGRAVEITPETELSALTASNFKAEQLEYTPGNAPVQVKVIDPLNVLKGNFTLAFKDTSGGSFEDAYWMLYGDEMTDTVLSDQSIFIKNEQLIPSIGMSVTVEQTSNPGYPEFNASGFISATLTFDDERLPWLTGVQDVDGNSTQNWIRSGASFTEDDDSFDDKYYGSGTSKVFLDPNEDFEKMVAGTWAPFRLGAKYYHGPLERLVNETSLYIPINSDNSLHFLSDVNIVFTANKDLWTRCPVIEMQDTVGLAENGAKKNYLRKALSLDKDGNAAAPNSGASTNIDAPNFISDSGMSWFPGYAIDVNTGERLNIAFGEDSWLQAENGADMLWNPTSTITEGPFDDVRFGGKHYVFVFRNNIVEEEAYTSVGYNQYNKAINRMPQYDYGAFIHNQLNKAQTTDFASVWRTCMYVGLPVLNSNYSLLATDARVKIRVTKPFEKNAAVTYLSPNEALQIGKNYLVQQGPVTHDGINYKRGDVFKAQSTSFTADIDDNTQNLALVQNDGLPIYQFNLDALAPSSGNTDLATSLLDAINVVPNPFYAYGEYNKDKLDNRIKITNLPQQCTITIYNVNGELIRQFNRDDASITSVDWDLNNHVKIPVASGMYIIHINAPGIGEKIVKAFIVMRQLDLDSF